MLKIVAGIPVDNCQLEVDEFVPLSFSCFEIATYPPLCWRTGDFRKSLIELKLNDRGGIFSVTATLLPHFSRSNDDRWVSGATYVEGAPVCDTASWPDSPYIDEAGEPLTHVGDDRVRIWLGGYEKIRTFYRVGRLLFGINGDSILRLLQFDSLPSSELEVISKSIIRSENY